MSNPQPRSGQLPAAAVWAIPAAAVALVLASFAGVFLLAMRGPGAAGVAKAAGDPAPAVAEPPQPQPVPADTGRPTSAQAKEIAAHPWFAGRCTPERVERLIDRMALPDADNDYLVVYDQDGRFGAIKYVYPIDEAQQRTESAWAKIEAAARSPELNHIGITERAVGTDYRYVYVSGRLPSRTQVGKLLIHSLTTGISYREAQDIMRRAAEHGLR